MEKNHLLAFKKKYQITQHREVLVCAPYGWDTAPGQRFRIEQWIPRLRRMGWKFRYQSFESEELNLAMQQSRGILLQGLLTLRDTMMRAQKIRPFLKPGNLLLIHRELLPLGPPWLERMAWRRGAVIIHDFDDAIYIPDTFRGKSWIKPFKCAWKTAEIARLSRQVTVGNQHLAEFVRPFNRCTTIIPTTIELDEYNPRQETLLPKKNLVIGWSGSWSTQRHLQILLPILEKLAQRRKFKLLVIGVKNLSCGNLNHEILPWHPARETEDLRRMDIGIMPLPDDRWSMGKCGLKLLQYMALGIPSVASPVGVNRDIIEHGQNGFLASSDSEWIHYLELLLGNLEIRKKFSVEGRKTVEKNYHAQLGADALDKVFRKVCPPQHSIRKTFG